MRHNTNMWSPEKQKQNRNEQLRQSVMKLIVWKKLMINFFSQEMHLDLVSRAG